MNTRQNKPPIRGLVVRLSVSLLILAGGWLYPALRLRYDSDIRNDPDFRAGAVLPLAICIGIAYAGLACWQFYRAREDLRFDHARKNRLPHE